jgi:hypothetical protein
MKQCCDFKNFAKVKNGKKRENAKIKFSKGK